MSVSVCAIRMDVISLLVTKQGKILMMPCLITVLDERADVSVWNRAWPILNFWSCRYLIEKPKNSDVNKWADMHIFLHYTYNVVILLTSDKDM